MASVIGRTKSQYYPLKIYSTRNPRLFFTTHEDDAITVQEITRFPRIFFFSSSVPENYRGFCLDQGPINIADVVLFCRNIQGRLANPQLLHRPLVYYTYCDPTCVTNSVLLLCAYLVLCEGCTPEEAFADFDRITDLPLEPYHDATYLPQTFRLHVIDVLHGLARAKSLGWVDVETFDAEAWERLYENPTHDLCEVCPKFVAMATPKDAADEWTVARPVSGWVGHLVELGVRACVRLNDCLYDETVLEASGIATHSLEFPDCNNPPAAVVKRFLDICDETGEERVAVHCLAGIGRTGTLIGCSLIKNWGFSAAEAIGYLRVMRPGSVLGQQQNFLEEVERSWWMGNLPSFLLRQSMGAEGGEEGEVEEAVSTKGKKRSWFRRVVLRQ